MVNRSVNAKKNGGRDPVDLLMSNQEGTHWAGPIDGVAALHVMRDVWHSKGKKPGRTNTWILFKQFQASVHPLPPAQSAEQSKAQLDVESKRQAALYATVRKDEYWQPLVDRIHEIRGSIWVNPQKRVYTKAPKGTVQEAEPGDWIAPTDFTWVEQALSAKWAGYSVQPIMFATMAFYSPVIFALLNETVQAIHDGFWPSRVWSELATRGLATVELQAVPQTVAPAPIQPLDNNLAGASTTSTPPILTYSEGDGTSTGGLITPNDFIWDSQVSIQSFDNNLAGPSNTSTPPILTHSEGEITSSGGLITPIDTIWDSQVPIQPFDNNLPGPSNTSATPILTGEGTSSGGLITPFDGVWDAPAIPQIKPLDRLSEHELMYAEWREYYPKEWSDWYHERVKKSPLPPKMAHIERWIEQWGYESFETLLQGTPDYSNPNITSLLGSITQLESGAQAPDHSSA